VGPGEEDVIFGRTHGGAVGEAKLADMAKRTGQDAGRVRGEMQRQLLTTRLAEKVTADVAISDEDVRKYYETHPQVARSPGHVRVRILSVDSREKADQLRAQIVRGADFGTLVRQHSMGGYKESGGDTGWIDPRFLPGPVAAAAGAAAINALTPVVEVQGRFFVVKVEGREGPREVPLAEAKDRLGKALLAERKRMKFTEWLEERRRSARIEIYL
jgi:parvulin-like peptidyl-prolyl isomerase